jgi:hypothetical protein
MTVVLPPASVFVKICCNPAKILPSGSWAVWGIANLSANYSVFPAGGLEIGDTHCELRSDNSFIGGATSRTDIQPHDTIKQSLSMFGGAQAVAGGSEISLWCFTQFGGESVDNSLIMAITLGGFQ